MSKKRKDIKVQKSLKIFLSDLSLRFCGAFFLLPSTADLVSQDLSSSFETLKPQATFEQGHRYFKKPHEVDAYFVKVKGGSNKNVQAYLKHYRPLILSASHTFDIPFSFQSCLIFKESRFNKKAVSSVGALGMAQFMKDTYSFLAKALYAGKKSLEQEGLSILEAESFDLFESKTNIEKSNLKKQREIYRRMYLRWQAYLDTNSLDEINLSKISYKKALKMPEYAIGFSSMYLFYLKQRVEFKLKKTVLGEHLLRHPDFFLSVAGAYNQGARRLFRAIDRHKKKPRFAKWISYQSRVGETKDYIRSIRTCMKSERSEATGVGPVAAF